MLPVLICEADENIRKQWLELFGELTAHEFPSVRLAVMPGTPQDLLHVLKAETGIVLVVLAVQRESEEAYLQQIGLFSQVMERNRDSYVIVCVQNIRHLELVLSRCMRPAGILMMPPQRELMLAGIRRILRDYGLLHDNSSDEEYMTVSSGKTMHRIAYRDILYMEAQDKLLNINLKHHSITVRNSLNALSETLPDEFIRCHRSYIVNRAYIEAVNLADMMLSLTTKERVPISRTYKDTLRTCLREGQL